MRAVLRIANRVARAAVARAVLPLAATLLVGGCGRDHAPVSVSPSSYDFGRVLQGEARRQTFTLTNHGQRTVAFTVQPNCGCFAVSRSLQPLDPGQSLDFEVHFTSANLSGPVRGKWIQIHTDHPDLPKIVLPLSGEVYRAYDLQPVLFYLGRIDGSDANYEPREVVIRPQGGFKVRFLGSFATPQVIAVTSEPLAGGGLTLSLRLRKDVRRPKGPFLAQVRLDLEVTGPEGEVKRNHSVVHLRGTWAL